MIQKKLAWETGKVIKLTAEKNCHTVNFLNEHWVVMDSEENYKKISTPFYNFVYEQIEKIRNENIM